MENKEIRKLSVALCTYNGERYIREQLESIIRQTYPVYEIVVCDDGSKDNTLRIIEDIAQNTSTCKIRLYSNNPNLGAVKNFEKAISLCEGELIACSDQDDVWDADKLSLGMGKMQKTENNFGKDTPILIHSDLRVVDKDLKYISDSFLHFQNIKHEYSQPLKVLLTQNFVTGCTMILNKPLKRTALPLPAQNIIMHDWWIAQIASTFGRLEFIDKPLISYRQHGGNVIGAKGFWKLISYYLTNISTWWVINKTNTLKTYYQALELKKHIITLGQHTDKLQDINKFISLFSMNKFFVIQSLLSSGIHRQGLIRQAGFIFTLLFTNISNENRPDKNN